MATLATTAFSSIKAKYTNMQSKLMTDAKKETAQGILNTK
jgi:hypothetical protein